MSDSSNQPLTTGSDWIVSLKWSELILAFVVGAIAVYQQDNFFLNPATFVDAAPELLDGLGSIFCLFGFPLSFLAAAASVCLLRAMRRETHFAGIDYIAPLGYASLSWPVCFILPSGLVYYLAFTGLGLALIHCIYSLIRWRDLWSWTTVVLNVGLLLLSLYYAGAIANTIYY